MHQLRVLVSASVLIVSIGAVWSMPAHAGTYYVRQAGSDGNSGTSPTNAFATIGRGASDARGGDTIIVGPGVYREGDIKSDGNGRREEPVVFFADHRGELTGDAPGPVMIDATGFDHAFDFSDRPWVVVNGFGIANSEEEGISIKNISDGCMVANCAIFSNGRDGIRVRDSLNVVLFNNLIYDNTRHGIEFDGEGTTLRPDVGSAGGIVINNTVYANGSDGIRIEQGPPSTDMLVINNVITENGGKGINLKEGSAAGFVGQWNLNTDGYNTSDVARGRLDTGVAPLFIAPAGVDGRLGGPGFADDDFRLRQLATGQSVESIAVDASPIRRRKLGMAKAASTRLDGAKDKRGVDLGFHIGNTTDFVVVLKKKKLNVVPMVQRSFDKRVRQFRSIAVKCEELATTARDERRIGTGSCVQTGRRKKLIKTCGNVIEDICR
jgi:parallel beta-helix repeat protein